jgi:REP element-mobilizing transposase RayT
MENSGDGEGAFYRRRRSIRLPHYDYAQRGVYFITLCVQHRRSLFGDVIDGSMVLKNLGEIVATEWRRTSKIRPNIAVDEFVVMPNHLHGLIVMEPLRRGVSHTPGGKFRSPAQTVSAIVRGFKGSTTRLINELQGTPGVMLWKRNYYEHIVRDDRELQRIREYIANNPAQWALDRENPEEGVYQYAPTDGIEEIFGGIRP